MAKTRLPPDRLELFAEIRGVRVEACFSRRKLVEAGGIEVPEIDLPDRLERQRATGREADARDVDRLTRGRRPTKPGGQLTVSPSQTFDRA